MKNNTVVNFESRDLDTLAVEDESDEYPAQAWKKREFKCLGWVETDNDGDELGTRRECWQRIQAGDAGYCEVMNSTSGQVFRVMQTTSLSLKDDTRFTCELAKSFSSFRFNAKAYRHDPPMALDQFDSHGIIMAVYEGVLPGAFASIRRLRDDTSNAHHLPRWEASLAIHAAAIHGHLDVAKYLHSRIDIPLDAIDRVKEDWRLYKRLKAISRQIGQNNNAAKVSGVTMLLAAQRGHADVVQWLYEEYHGDPRINLFWVYSDAEAKYVSVVDAAAANGHLEIVKYLLQVGKEGNDSVGPPQKRQRTQESSNFTVREDMHDTHSELLDDPTMPSCTKKAIDNAAAAGHLDVVKWLHVNRTDGCTADAMDLAALNGHLEVVQWLDANRNEGCTTGAMDNAATSGELAVVKWLHEHRTEGCTLAAMNGAASNGFLIVVKWLHDNRSEGCSSAAMNGAAARGALDAVKWLHHHRSESCTPLAMDEAARKGHLHVLRWLFENRDEGFTTVAVYNAAQAGHFETVLILHNLAQKGLVPEVEKMNEDASMVLISDIYQEVVRAVLPKTDE
ncbi:hypothetical protein AM588_10007390 [Phytophthora nicotianae]|uniref:Uncharacterized protein n=1 Tax=Phytophthora nicotianae TaxID=4792 RepID=A0A0W8DP42_PHYNI|nr:hypothetical protein AM588_10007390 [Phytophthora nicotianae]